MPDGQPWEDKFGLQAAARAADQQAEEDRLRSTAQYGDASLLDDTPFIDRVKQVGRDMGISLDKLGTPFSPVRRVTGFHGVVTSEDAAGVEHETEFEGGIPRSMKGMGAYIERDSFQILAKAAIQYAYDRAEDGRVWVTGRTVGDLTAEQVATTTPPPGLNIREHIDASTSERERGMVGAREAAIADLEGQVTAVKESGIYKSEYPEVFQALSLEVYSAVKAGGKVYLKAQTDEDFPARASLDFWVDDGSKLPVGTTLTLWLRR